MAHPLRPATPQEHAEHAENGEKSIVSAQNGHNAGSSDPAQAINNDRSASPQVHDSVDHSHINIENTPISIDHLVLQQLREDLDAYRYDLEFSRAQLDPINASDITPAEIRTFQLRILDLGHQMRMLNHRIQLMEAAMQNSRVHNNMAGRVGAAASNAYWGPYPPGTSVQPGAYSVGAGPTPIGNGHYGQGPSAGMSMMQSPAAYSAYPEYPQERRGPGRPLGSKNRPRPSLDPQSVPPNNSVKASSLASAAALATAGAKRDNPSEICVAPPNGAVSSFSVAADGEPPCKRPRLDVQVGTPMSNNLETDEKSAQNVINAAGNSVSRIRENDQDLKDTEMQLHTTFGPSPSRQPSFAGSTRLAPSGLATPYGTPSAPVVPTLSAGSASYDGPAGNEFKRLGGWRCRLCTSQKYLNAPPPKQPSEPGHWPLRDISKMVTHFTRMHGEHNNVERCMELGAALGANRGPFRHWLLVTKKEKGIDHDAVDSAVEELETGRMPAILRKVSTSAANFPRE
ncbi:hypothetical protein N0V93_008111 [Gnomoniopsis smithogilvyi]|uniref:Uncharacterized protein n=1 Tax=Gnomoniopsis smithogilvyi TaxID=1191159 RepID=A0A9W8YNI1_9PEZI|nr:hypothetical protein N0V93_008111 [Gnomoniopsis smithogilvyi]